uniref:F-box domain-containing protein n=1 Tax=Oryza brachyantha TaxID=4533 RepID=J3N3I7_ORYBR
MGSVPDDILIDIFSYLPARSAARLPALSRSWRAALSSAFFVDLHLRRANRTPRLLCGACDYKLEKEWCFYAVCLGGSGGGGGGGRRGHVEELMRGEFSDVTACFGKNGLYVCNPSTGEVLAVPDTEIPRKTTLRPSRALPRPPRYLRVAYGLGYSSATREMKVVRLFSQDTSDPLGPSPTICEVFVLDTPACWRPAAGKPPPECVVEYNTAGAFLNVSLHFLWRDGRSIVTFNVTDESFGTLPLSPPPAATAGAEDWQIVETITELDGRLCVCQSGRKNIWPLDLSSMAAARRRRRRNDGVGETLFHRRDRKAVPRPESALGRLGRAAAAMHARGQEDLDADGAESLTPVGRTAEEIALSSPATRAWFYVLKWLPARTVSELSLACREWRAVVTTDSFVRSHAVHANMAARRPRVRFLAETIAITYGIDRADEVYTPFPSAKPFVYVPVTSAKLFVCSQPCHGLNVGSFSNRLDFICNPDMEYLPATSSTMMTMTTALAAAAASTTIASTAASRRGTTRRKTTRWWCASPTRRRTSRRGATSCDASCATSNGRSGFACQPRPAAGGLLRDAGVRQRKDLLAGRPGACPAAGANDGVRAGLARLPQRRRVQVRRRAGPTHSVPGRLSVLRLHGALCVACSDRDANTIDVWALKGAVWSMEYRLELAGHSPEYMSENATLMCVDPTSGRILLNTERSLGYYDAETGELETIYRVPRWVEPHERFCAV